MKLVVFAIGLLASVGASAAPFCVITSYGESCWYYQADECQRVARQQNGICAVNQADQQQQQQPQRPVSTAPPFCVVDAAGQRCWYYTADACYQAARSTNGACVVNQDR